MRKEILEQIGLTKSEINVYLALLELGSSSTGKIVDKAEVASSKIYEILDKLIQKGLVSFIIKSGVKYFEAAPPERIMDYMKEKEAKFNEQKEELQKILPELELKRKLSKYKSEATIFKGIEGAKTAFGDILKTLKKGDEYYVIGVTHLECPFARFIKHYHLKRSKKGIKVKLLFAEKGRQWAENIKDIPLTEIRFVPSQLLASSFVLMYKDKTLITVTSSKEDLTFFRIENKEVTDSFKSQFELLWDQKVQTFEGQEAVESVFNSIIKSAKPNDIIDIFAAKPATKRGADFNVDWNREIRKKVKNVRLMYYGDNPKNRARAKEIEKQGCETKIIPTEQTLPISTIVVGDKVFNAVWGKKPLTFKIENKTVADSFKENFNLLWNQEVEILRGVEGVYNAWDSMLDELKPGEEYYVMGAADRGQKGIYNYLVDFHKRRQAKGVKSKFLFVSGTEKYVEEFKDNYTILSEVKYLPQGIYKGIQFNFFKNKVLIIVWKEKEPIVFRIEDKKVYHTFKTYFDTLWDQETTIVKGLDAIQSIFEEMLEAGGCDFIGARGYFTDARPKYTDQWEKKAIAKGFKMRNIVDPGTRGHRITKFSFVKTKYTLPKEFTQLSVFWIYGDKVVISNWTEKEPIAVIIENKALYDMYKEQFELLWKKEMDTYKGPKGIKTAFQNLVDELNPGEEVHIMGVHDFGEEFLPLALFFQEIRSKKGIKAKFLMNKEAKNIAEKFKDYPPVEIKFMPEGVFTPAIFLIYNDKVIINLAKEKTFFVIESKSTAMAFESYFQLMWNQYKF
jgi:sugar-specific transcriptional regulator TrmB